VVAPVRVTVTDCGPGVPEAKREAIFARFRQADGGETRSHGGLGAGLSLARDLIELMGGRIGVDDAPGGGAAFWIELARDPADGAADRERAAQLEAAE
jgi:signal transduction histidine kinase